MTDVRQASVQQKLISFYTIIERCLRNDQRVNVVVVLGAKNIVEGRAIYTECLSDYLQDKGFNLIFVTPASWLSERLMALIYVAIYFAKLRGDFATRLNFACLSALARVRINTFYALYDALPCRHWLGLTGGVELPALKYRRDQSAAGACINALQFGQASLEQRHFAAYKVDNFFVYDELSASVFKRLHMQVTDLVLAGSPEFEYHKSRLRNEKLAEEAKLNIIFVDQPVLQRGEYNAEFIRACYSMLRALNDDPDIRLRIKRHPRGSAFDGVQLSDFSVVDDWSDCLSKAHVVIGFFSNLCDFALSCGRVTFYVGSSAVLDREKNEWITSQGGYISDDIDYVRREISQLKRQCPELARNIISSARSASNLSSEIIYNKMVACSESKAFA